MYCLMSRNGDKGAGVDRFTLSILQQAPEPVLHMFHEAVTDMMKYGRYTGFKTWVAVLLRKKKEDPRKFDRLRDIWLIPHTIKLITAMLDEELKKTCQVKATHANAGFAKKRGCPEQTLTIRCCKEIAITTQNLLL